MRRILRTHVHELLKHVDDLELGLSIGIRKGPCAHTVFLSHMLHLYANALVATRAILAYCSMTYLASGFDGTRQHAEMHS